MTKIKMDDLPKLLEEVSFSIKKNIESNSEETEVNILNRFEQLEKVIYQAMGIKDVPKDEDSDEDADDLIDNKDKSIADKFHLPAVKVDASSEVISNIESNILDTNCRLDNLETSIANMHTKLNDLIKVNNMILKRLEATNTNFMLPNMEQDRPSLTIGSKKTSPKPSDSGKTLSKSIKSQLK